MPTEPDLEQNIGPIPIAPKNEEEKKIDRPYMPRKTENPMTAAVEERKSLDYEPTILTEHLKITRPTTETLREEAVRDINLLKNPVRQFLPEENWGGFRKEVNEYIEAKKLEHEKSKITEKEKTKVKSYDPIH